MMALALVGTIWTISSVREEDDSKTCHVQVMTAWGRVLSAKHRLSHVTTGGG